MDELIKKVADQIRESNWTVALTGAGISVDSGIPDFRSPGGLWTRFDPYEYATIDAFRADPEKVWTMINEMHGIVSRAKPNPGHIALAQMEELGYLKAVVTQNIDNLHQDAGNKRVIEFHGNAKQLVCLEDGKKYSADSFEGSTSPPRCECGRILKPDVVLFGEAIPIRASIEAQHEAQECNVMLVIGTSAMVAPASSIPVMAKSTGGVVIEVNPNNTPLTGAISDCIIHGSASEVLPRIVEHLKDEKKSNGRKWPWK